MAGLESSPAPAMIGHPMPSIIVRREFAIRGLMKDIIIEVDGRPQAQIKHQGSAHFLIPPGIHSVQARMGGLVSMPIKVALKDREEVGLLCRAPRFREAILSLREVFHVRIPVRFNAAGLQPSAAKRGRSSSAYAEEQGTTYRQANGETAFSSSGQTLDWNLILQVPIDASFDEIRCAYRQLMRQYHPDLAHSLGKEAKELAERMSRDINAAYSTAIRHRRHRGY